MQKSFLKIKNFHRLKDIIKLDQTSFQQIGYVLHRALEIKTLENYKFKRPMLEIGMGSGYISSLFFNSMIDCGIEIKKYSANFYNFYKKVIFTNKNSRSLPFKKNSFNTVYSLSVLEHVKKLDSLLKESYRILKPNGYFIANVNTDSCKRKPMCLTKESCPNLLTPADWKQLLQKNGFIVKKIMPALPAWVPSKIKTASSGWLTKIPLINKIWGRFFWQQIYKKGALSANIDKSLTITLICKKK